MRTSVQGQVYRIIFLMVSGLSILRFRNFTHCVQLREKSRKKQEIWPEAKTNYIKEKRKKRKGNEKAEIKTGWVGWSQLSNGDFVRINNKLVSLSLLLSSASSLSIQLSPSSFSLSSCWFLCQHHFLHCGYDLFKTFIEDIKRHA